MLAETNVTRFHVVDYLIFFALLLAALLVGAWFAYADRKKKSTDEYLMAGKRMKVLPVSLSMFVSWISAVALLGDPVEVYRRGSNYALLGVGYVLALPAVAFFFAPYYHSLNIISIFAFLEMRYNKPLRLFASIINIIILVSWSSVMLYGPSLAVSQVTGFPIWACMITSGSVAVVYTAMGGMKAILWVDTIQMATILIGLLALFISGVVKLGGLGNMFAIAKEGGRLELGSLVPNPAAGTSIWSHLIGGFFMIFVPYMSSQLIVQRYSTLETSKQVKCAVLLNAPVILCTVLLLWLCGLVMFSVFAEHDPLEAGRITHRDQMMPLLVMDLLGAYPGLPGLIMAAIFSGSLSSLSSCYNACAATTLADFIQPLVKHIRQRPLSEASSMRIARALAFFYGTIVICLAFSVLGMGKTIFNLSLQICGTFGSPLGAVFVLGVVCPKFSKKSVMFGLFVSTVVMLWIGISSLLITRPNDSLGSKVITPNTMNETIYSTHSWMDTMGTTLDPVERNGTARVKQQFQVGDFHPLYYNTIGVVTAIVSTLIFRAIELFINKVTRHKKAKGYGEKDVEPEMYCEVPLHAT